MTRLTWLARCRWAGHDQPHGCGWQLVGAPADECEREAEKHTRRTGHATCTEGRPAKEDR